MINDDVKRKLRKCPKEVIIDCLVRHWEAEHIIQEIIYKCDEKAKDKLYEEDQKAWETYNKALKRYYEWKQEMCSRYGDGKTVKLADIPQKEIERGARIERDFAKAAKNCDKCTEQIINFSNDIIRKKGE